MPELTLKDVSLSFGERPLLDGVNLVLEPKERVGLLGRNGCGKSTLLGVLAGAVEVESGEIVRRRGLRVATMAQQIPDQREGPVSALLERALAAQGLEVAPHEVEKRCARALAAVQLDADTDWENLSAGGRRRALLAAAMVVEPDVLLLDEPTNHLDVDAIARLEETLLGWNTALVFVTHDRALLRRVATRILDLDRGRLDSYACGYEEYLERKEAALQKEEEERAKLDKDLQREEAWIRRGVKGRVKRDMGRVRALEALREKKSNLRERQGGIDAVLQAGGSSGRIAIRLEDLHFGYDERPLVKGLEAIIERGDRVGLIGPNGCGKTTLVRLLLKEVEPRRGRVHHGTRLEIGRMDQIPDLREDLSLIENLPVGGEHVSVGGKDVHVLGYLGNFLFSAEQARAPVSMLSGGERRRLQLARLLAYPCNLLVLDEPTNDLDLESLDFLEETIAAFEGTVLLVSHDRDFLDRTATFSFAFEGEGSIRVVSGGYAAWQRVRKKAEPRAGRSPRKAAVRDAASAEQPKARKLSFKERRELEGLPARIEALEAQKEELEARMADPEHYRRSKEVIASTKARFDEVSAEVSALYARWEELEALA